jgi:hypothetical protein
MSAAPDLPGDLLSLAREDLAAAEALDRAERVSDAPLTVVRGSYGDVDMTPRPEGSPGPRSLSKTHPRGVSRTGSALTPKAVFGWRTGVLAS